MSIDSIYITKISRFQQNKDRYYMGIKSYLNYELLEVD